MDFVLKNSDVEQALVAHINALGINTQGKKVQLSFKTTRKPVTITVNVAITNADNTAAAVVAPVPTVKEAAAAVITTTATVEETKPAPVLEAVQSAPVEADTMPEEPAADPAPVQEPEAAPTNTVSLFS